MILFVLLIAIWLFLLLSTGGKFSKEYDEYYCYSQMPVDNLDDRAVEFRHANGLYSCESCPYRFGRV